MDIQNTSSQNPEKTKRFLGVEYAGRSVAVRRSANYEITVALIKESFKPLRSVSAERIAISAFIEELDGTLEVSKHIWSDLLPDLKHITVTLDSSSSEPAEAAPEAQKPNADVKPSLPHEPAGLIVPPRLAPPTQSTSSAPNQDNKNITVSQPIIPPPPPAIPSSSSDLPGTLPPQPTTWGKDQRHTLIARYGPVGGNFKTVQGVVTKPTTTIADLKEFVKSRCPFKTCTRLEYRYLGQEIDGRQYVSELDLRSNQANYLEVSLFFD